MNIRFFAYILVKKVKGRLKRRSTRVYKACQEQFKNPPNQIEFIGRYGLAWKLIFDHYILKCFEVDSTNKASKIVNTVSLLKQNKIRIPGIVGRNGKFLFSEWINGVPLSKQIRVSPELIQIMAEYQAQIHDTRNNTEKPTFEQWGLIKNRLVQLTKIRFKDTMCTEVAGLISRLDRSFSLMARKLPTTITHPGFTPDNIVLKDSNELFLIDNEVLSTGIGREFDLLYTLEHNFRRFGISKTPYFQYYSDICDISEFNKNYHLWEACESMRVIGKQLTFIRSDPHAAYRKLMEIDGRLYG